MNDGDELEVLKAQALCHRIPYRRSYDVGLCGAVDQDATVGLALSQGAKIIAESLMEAAIEILKTRFARTAMAYAGKPLFHRHIHDNCEIGL